MTTPDPFAPGYRLTDGDQLNERIANPVWSSTVSLAATAGGTVVTSAKIVDTITNVTYASAPGAGVTIPQALQGTVLLVYNNSSNDITVFAAGDSTIGGLPGNIGVTLPATSMAMYFATNNLEWQGITSGQFPPVGSVTRRQLFNAMVTQGILFQISQAVEINTPTWVDFNAAQNLTITDPLGVLIVAQIGPAAAAALWVLAGTYAP